MNRRGSIGLVCILIITLVLLVCQSLYMLIASDYRYVKSYVRQRQVVHAVSSGLQALERVSSSSDVAINRTFTESLPPDDLMELTMSTYQQNGVKWMVCKGTNADIVISMVQGVCGLPSSTGGLYEHSLVASGFNIDPAATVEGSMQNYLNSGDGKFVNFDIAVYARYAFALPETEGWKSGLGRNVFRDPFGASLRLPGGQTVRGDAVFVSQSDITINVAASYPDKLQLIANGNVIVEGNTRLDNVFILSNNSVKISQGSRVSGKIFARRSIIIEKNVIIKDLPTEQLVVTTDKYLW